MKSLIIKGIIVALVTISCLQTVFAQAETIPFAEKFESEILVGTILLIMLILFFTVLFLFSQLMGTIKDMRKEILKERGLWKEEEEESVIDRFWKKASNQLTDAVPVEEEEEIQMDHEYDGIRELDNNLPPWWKWMFYVSIIWSVVYLFHFHVLGNGQLMHDEYQAEMEEAEEAREKYLKLAANRVDETNVTFLDAATDLQKGQQIFINNCAACHSADGGGEIGPNLTDQYWINGGGIKNIFEVIKYGRPQKGMISWQAQLKPYEMQQVASYIMSLQGTDPVKPKEPEGEIWVDESQTETSDTTATPPDATKENEAKEEEPSEV